jgi:hypothetical protein
MVQKCSPILILIKRHFFAATNLYFHFIKELEMKKTCLGILLSLGTVVSINAIAQTTPASPTTPGAGNMMGGVMQHGMKFGSNNTPGWSMMSRAEHKEHRDKMHSMKNYDECKAYHDEHMKQMEARAKEKGKTFNTAGMKPCETMKEKGMVNQT